MLESVELKKAQKCNKNKKPQTSALFEAKEINFREYITRYSLWSGIRYST